MAPRNSSTKSRSKNLNLIYNAISWKVTQSKGGSLMSKKLVVCSIISMFARCCGQLLSLNCWLWLGYMAVRHTDNFTLTPLALISLHFFLFSWGLRHKDMNGHLRGTWRWYRFLGSPRGTWLLSYSIKEGHRCSRLVSKKNVMIENSLLLDLKWEFEGKCELASQAFITYIIWS